MEKKITTLIKLGEKLKNIPENILEEAYIKNNWFTKENVKFCLNNWSRILIKEDLIKWFSKYNFSEINPKNVGIICAGNIPLVGLHDLICAYVANHNLKIKLSSSDYTLMKYIIGIINDDKIEIVTSLKNIDLVIATGSNNTFRYFDYYFGKLPNILRKNRSSIAVLNGKETEKELEKLSDDIFLYFGLGCRNISKIYLPKDYNLDKLFKAFYKYKDISNHNKYKNNYDYYRSIFMLDKVPFLENGFCILKEDGNISTPLSVLNYEYYNNLEKVKEDLKKEKENIQCIVSKINLGGNTVSFGENQKTNLDTYADNIDTLSFLSRKKITKFEN